MAWLPLTHVHSTQGLVADEHALVRRAQAGDKGAFAALVERYWDGLYRWLYHLTHDQHTAEDRAAFLLRVEEGLSFREIARILGVTEETARWRVFKARQKLLTVLAPQLDLKAP